MIASHAQQGKALEARRNPLRLLGFAFLVALMMAGGCGRPSAANIELRKQNQTLQQQIDSLKQDLANSQARIEGLQQRIGTVPTLPEKRLEELFTTHNIEIGRLTGGLRLDPDKPWDQGIRVYVTPVDDAGDPLKATGRLVVDAYDLMPEEPNRIGQWVFSPEQLKDQWRGLGPIHAFVVDCPWQAIPKHPQVALKVMFQDALTGRVFNKLHEVKVVLPPAPATKPSTRPSPAGI